MNEYKLEHRLPTIEYFLSEYKNKSVCLYTANKPNEDFQCWAEDYFSDVYYFMESEYNTMLADIVYLDEKLPPYELLSLLCKSYDKLRIGGLLICNYFFDNKPLDEFEDNPRYGLDAFSFVVQHRVDVLYKGNQIIFKKLG
jgi:hypothetical protein